MMANSTFCGWRLPGNRCVAAPWWVVAMGIAAGLVGMAPAHAATSSANIADGRSYAVIVGVSRYPDPRWPDLSHARKDAEGMARILKRQGFNIFELYDRKATASAIMTVLEDRLAPRLRRNDRILFFFSGHGHTQTLAGREFGYLVPYDGSDSFASLLSMQTLRGLSAKLDAAKHQVFIIDACFGGQFAPTKSAVAGISPTHPRYIEEIMRRTSRQFLTAGGQDQQVLDGGPEGYSYFTGYLIKAIRDGLGDLNGDGYITMSELTTYLVPKATNAYQTPGAGTLPGHGLGEFVFQVAPVARNRNEAGAGDDSDDRAVSLGIKGDEQLRGPSPPRHVSRPSPSRFDRQRFDQRLKSERDQLRFDLTGFILERGHVTDSGFEVQMVWDTEITDVTARGFVVRIEYEALTDSIDRETEVLEDYFLIRPGDGEFDILDKVSPRG